MTNTTPAPLTYGDTFTIPSAPGVVWEIRDLRSTTDPAPMRRAYAHPVSRDGVTLGYDDAVKIGRAERVGLEIAFTLHHARPLQAYLTTRGYVESPTDAQRAAVDADMLAFALDFPPLDAAETVRRIVARASERYTVTDAARAAVKALSLPAYYDDGYAEIRTALRGSPELAEIRAALIAGFAAEIESWTP